jgi:hypothetical protein
MRAEFYIITLGAIVMTASIRKFGSDSMRRNVKNVWKTVVAILLANVIGGGVEWASVAS